MAGHPLAASQWLKQKALDSQRLQPALLIGSAVVLSVMTMRIAPGIGAYVGAFALIFLVALALIFIRIHRLAIIAVIIPLSYWIVLSLPQQSKGLQTVYLYGGLLLLGLAYRHMLARELPVERFRTYMRRVPTLLCMAALGIALGTMAFFALPDTQPPLFGSLLIMAVFAIGCAAIEVIFFQGLLQPIAAKTVPPSAAAILTGILFASMTWAGSLHALLVALLFGLVLAGMYYCQPRTLVYSMIINVTAKLSLVVLLAFAS